MIESQQSNIDISIVATMYNEEINLDYFFERLLSVMQQLNLEYEIICVNDGSTDGTLESLLRHRQGNPRIKIINFSRNFGKENALTAGLKYSQGRAVIPIDSDLQDPPELIEQLLSKWREGYDVVYAMREKRIGETWAKRLTAAGFYHFINYFSETPIPKNTGDFRLMDRRVVEVLNKLPERTRFMKGLFAWVGFKQVGIPFERQPRHLGKTKWNFWNLWNYALDGITLFSTSPLRMWAYIGIIISLAGFAYAMFLAIRVLILGIDVPGYASTMVAILFLGGLNLISLGIVGEYLGRVYAEVKKRPLYIVNNSYGFEKDAGKVDYGD